MESTKRTIYFIQTKEQKYASTEEHVKAKSIPSWN